MNYSNRLKSAAPYIAKPLDCRKLKFHLSFHMLKTEQISELANKIVHFAEQLADDEIIVNWSCGHKNVSAKQAKKCLADCFDPAIGLNFGFEGYLSSPVIHNVSTLKKHQSFIKRVNPVYMYDWPNFDMSSVDYQKYFDQLFADPHPDNREIIKKVHSIFCEPNRNFLWFHAHADLAVRFSSMQYASHPGYYYGETAFGISAFSAGDAQDLIADAMADFVTALSKEYVNINALIGLQPGGITDDPYMRYFGHYVAQDGSHEDAACTAKEWYPYYYLRGVEWLNIISPRTKELILAPHVSTRDDILIRDISGGGLKVQSMQPISAYNMDTALALKHILLDTLYPGKTFVPLKSLLPKAGASRIYSWCPRSDWAIVPIEESEIGVIGTDLVYVSANSMTYTDALSGTPTKRPLSRFLLRSIVSRRRDGDPPSAAVTGGKLIRETIATGGTVTDTLDFIYDHAGHPYALKHTTGGVTTTYYYITNLQGDVLSLVNASGTPVATYTYDPYGKPLTATGTLANINPLRYRSYVYDPETGLYYLQSRYYDPAIGRFINADSYASTGQGILGNNMFAYCNGSPILYADDQGSKPDNSIYIRFGEGAYVQHFGQGTAISMSIYNQSIYIDAYITFHGDLAPNSLIAGIKDYWEGTYTDGTYTYNVFITIHHGKSANGNTINVYAYNDNFRGFCMRNPLTWSSTKESTIVMSSNYSSASYKWTIAHEFGHCLGVSDYYTQANSPNFDKNFVSIMNRAGMHASFNDIMKVIDANKYGIYQHWYCVGGL